MHHTTSLIAQRHAHGARDRRIRAEGRINPQLLQKLALGFGLALLIGGVIWGLRHWADQASAPKRQVARIAILPDTPPPPPPPPPKERKEEVAKAEAKPQPQPDNTPKPPPAPANEPLKMEGTAGNGPSAFQAGSVAQDYKGGTPQIGGTAASAVTATDRAAERLYAGSVRQLLRDEIEKQLSPDAGELTAAFALWIAGDGRITRWEFDGAAPPDPTRQGALKLALDRSADQLRLPAPPAVSQPMRFRLTVRAGG